jgi:hypothetical protein
MAFAIKAEIPDPRAKAFSLVAQKTMYGGKHIAEGDTVFLFASENEGGQGLIARRCQFSQGDGKEARERQANAACERRRQAHRAREAAAGPKRTQTVH